MSERGEIGDRGQGPDVPKEGGQVSPEFGRSGRRDSGSWAVVDDVGPGDGEPEARSESPRGDAPSHGDVSWAEESGADREQLIADARAEVDRAHVIADARAEVGRAYGDEPASRAETSWASVAERPALDDGPAESTRPADATDAIESPRPADAADATGVIDGMGETPEPWQTTEIRDNDWDGLRQLDREGSPFSEHRMMWVDVDDPRLESSEHVRGETFKGGESPDSYKRDIAALYERRDELTEVGDVDPRHTGDHKIRIEETEEGELTITNGYHRVQAAREAGVPAVLADASAFRGRGDRDR